MCIYQGVCIWCVCVCMVRMNFVKCVSVHAYVCVVIHKQILMQLPASSSLGCSPSVPSMPDLTALSMGE